MSTTTASKIEVSVRAGLPTVIVVGAPDAYTARVREILSQRDTYFLSRVTVNIDGPLPPHATVANAIEAHGEEIDPEPQTSIANEYIAAGAVVKDTTTGVEALVIQGGHHGGTLTVSRMDTAPGEHESWPCDFTNLSLVSQPAGGSMLSRVLDQGDATDATPEQRKIIQTVLKERKPTELMQLYREAKAHGESEVRRWITAELIDRLGREATIAFEERAANEVKEQIITAAQARAGDVLVTRHDGPYERRPIEQVRLDQREDGTVVTLAFEDGLGTMLAAPQRICVERTFGAPRVPHIPIIPRPADTQRERGC